MIASQQQLQRKKKVNAKSLSLQEQWTNDSSVVEVLTLVCLVCVTALIVNSWPTASLQLKAQAELSELGGQMDLDKISTPE